MGKAQGKKLDTSCYVMKKWTVRDEMERHTHVGRGNAFTLCYHEMDTLARHFMQWEVEKAKDEGEHRNEGGGAMSSHNWP